MYFSELNILNSNHDNAVQDLVIKLVIKLQKLHFAYVKRYVKTEN